MKIAVCFSGQARFAKENYQHTYDNLISPLGADVFCHFWNTEERETGMDPLAAIRLYKPKGAHLEEQISFFPEISEPKLTEVELWRLRRLTSMFYSAHLSLVSSLHYDVVIKCRTDLLFKREITLDDISKGRSSLCFYYDFTKLAEEGALRIYGDEIFWGPREMMFSLTRELALSEPDTPEMTHPAKVFHKVMERMGFPSIHVDIGQPNIMRNPEHHTRRLESLGRGEAPKNDD